MLDLEGCLLLLLLLLLAVLPTVDLVVRLTSTRIGHALSHLVEYRRTPTHVALD